MQISQAVCLHGFPSRDGQILINSLPQAWAKCMAGLLWHVNYTVPLLLLASCIIHSTVDLAPFIIQHSIDASASHL